VQISAMTSAVSGLQAATRQVDAAAAETLQATVPTDRVTIGGGGEADLISASADRITGELMFRANLKTLQTAKQMDDVLLQLITGGR
jgi:hypothetical protein